MTSRRTMRVPEPDWPEDCPRWIVWAYRLTLLALMCALGAVMIADAIWDVL